MGAMGARRPLRVLHVTPYFAPAFCYGGPPRSILGLAQGLRRVGVDVEVFTTTANGAADLPASPRQCVQHEGVPVRYFPRAFPRGLFAATGLDAAMASVVGRHDLVHVHGLWNAPSWIGARRARRAGVPYVVSPRGMLDAGSMARHPRRKRLAYWAVERANLAHAAFIHVTSEAEADSVARHDLGVPVVTVPNGVECPVGREAIRGTFRRRLKIGADAPLIAFLGRIHPMKRLDLLAAAFGRVHAVEPAARLVIAGPDEARGYRDQIASALAGTGGAVCWTGPLEGEQREALLRDADALVLCSDSESFGMSVLEALAAGVPVVVTRTCPWPEVATAGCGFWVPQSAEAIAAALLDLLSDPIGARAMGERGRALARTKYSWDAIAAAMAERYESAVAARSGLMAAP
jgi:glycosyltransferase involved in cell wall biosynthesis